MQLSERLLTPGAEHTTELVANLQRKQELLEAGDSAHEDIRTALVIGGGTMRGVFSGGVVTGLEELGLTEVFDDVIGVSVGHRQAPTSSPNKQLLEPRYSLRNLRARISLIKPV
jgi:predicted acylesterase/phospholipase RssA